MLAVPASRLYVGRMTRLLILVAALALVLLAAVPASAHYRAVGNDCGAIQFTPQTDDGADDIYAKNVKCRTARRIVRAYRRGNRTPLEFRCRGRAHDPSNGLGHRDVVCTRAGGFRRVSFGLY